MGEREARGWLADDRISAYVEQAMRLLRTYSSEALDVAVGVQVAGLGYACGRRSLRLAALSAIGLAATLRFGPRLLADDEAHDAGEVAVRRAQGQAELGRQLAIYDRVTGLLSYWFIALRGDEECLRSGRYEVPLTITVVETHPNSNSEVEELAKRFASSVRDVDIVGYLGNGRFIALMPNTDLGQAAGVRARLAGLGFDQCATATYGVHGTSFEELYQAALARVSAPGLSSFDRSAAA